MVDLLNQEMNELQAHQKQIEEIEKEYKEWAVGLLKVRFDLKPEAFDEHHKNNYSFENCADCLWNKIKGSIEELLWLRENQIPENAVVLTRERYEELEKAVDSVQVAVSSFTRLETLYKIKCKELEIAEEKARKETAEKFAERLKKMAYQSTDWSHGEHPMVVEVDYIDEICEEITEGKV